MAYDLKYKILVEKKLYQNDIIFLIFIFNFSIQELYEFGN
jgi:hypothetical protein